MTHVLIELRDVSRTFGATHALADVTADMAAGEFVAIEGPSGGGKSTLLNVLGLLDAPDGGIYLLDGADTAQLTPAARARLRSSMLGFVFQAFHLLDRRPVRDSVELGLLYRGVPRAQRAPRVQQALDAVGLGDIGWQPANTLSGGQRQRVAIARALASRAPLILADEPTGNLDSENGEAVFAQLRRLCDRGATVVMVTHSHSLAERADRVITIKDGRLEAGASQLAHCESALPRAVAAIPPQVDVPRDDAAPQDASGIIGTASTMRVADAVRDAVASLRSRLGRTAGLVGSVALAVALVVATLGILYSARAQVSDQFDAHESRDVTIGWSAADFPDGRAPTAANVRAGLHDLRGVAAVATLREYDAVAIAGSPVRQPLNAPIAEVSADYAVASRADVTWAGGTAHKLDDDQVLLGQSLAQQLELAPVALRPTVQISGLTYIVAGLVTGSPRVPTQVGAILTGPAGVARLHLGEPQHQTALILSSTGAAQQVARQASVAVNPYRPRTVTVQAPVDPTTVRGEVESSVATTLYILTGVALLVAIASLTNAMSQAVVERKQEIGLRRALGARGGHIASLVSAEAAIVGLVGGLAGLIAGVVAILAMTISQGWIPVFDIRLAPVAILCGVLVGSLGGLLAARRATRIQPSDALRL